MTVKDAAFFKGVEPLKFAELPEVRQEVVVYGFPEDGAYVQSMENESLTAMYGLKSNQSGALVTAVIPGSPADGSLLPGDVILSNLINSSIFTSGLDGSFSGIQDNSDFFRQLIQAKGFLNKSVAAAV